MGAAENPVRDSDPNMDEAAHRAGVKRQQVTQAAPVITTGTVEATGQRNTAQGSTVTRQPAARHMRHLSFWQKLLS